MNILNLKIGIDVFGDEEEKCASNAQRYIFVFRLEMVERVYLLYQV